MSSQIIDFVQEFFIGTFSFTFKEIAFVGDVKEIFYVPWRRGLMRITMYSTKTVVSTDRTPYVAEELTIYLSLASVEIRGRELIITLGPKQDLPHYGKIFSLRMKD